MYTTYSYKKQVKGAKGTVLFAHNTDVQKRTVPFAPVYALSTPSFIDFT